MRVTQMTTIAAISTPNAAGGIGMVRLSGDAAFAVADACFRAVSGRRISEMKGYTAAYGRVFDADGDIDDGVCVVYRAPHSFTGENTVEICCHGGLFVMQKVLRAVLAAGAIPAGPGEFTKRAFLNGKMDLAQAESVMGVISAQGTVALNASRSALEGAVSRKTESISSMLLSAAASLAAWADYPEDDVPAVDGSSLASSLENAASELEKLIERCDNGKAVTEGVRTVICGKPNVGKSTLMNLLSGYDRSIVTSIAGTTRDVVEETVRLGDIVLRLADTAGIRDTDDEVEKIGVTAAKKRIENADLTVAVFDISRALSDEDRQLLEQCKNKRCVAVINKTDLVHALDIDEIKKYIPETVLISAKDVDSADDLKTSLERVLGVASADFTQEMLIGERQRSCAVKALAYVKEALDALNGGLTLDAVNVSIDCALGELMSLTGKRVTDETVNEVFAKFCVGK